MLLYSNILCGYVVAAWVAQVALACYSLLDVVVPVRDLFPEVNGTYITNHDALTEEQKARRLAALRYLNDYRVPREFLKVFKIIFQIIFHFQ